MTSPSLKKVVLFHISHGISAVLCCVVLYGIVVEHVCAVPSWEAIHFINKLLKLYLM